MTIVKKTENKLWFSGYGQDPYVYVAESGAEDKFLGGVFLVENYTELEKYGPPYPQIIDLVVLNHNKGCENSRRRSH